MEWTEGRKRSFIISGLRAASRRWPPKYETLADAFVGKKINEKSGREAKHYLCNACKNEFTAANVEVDHIIPIIHPSNGFTTWDDFIKNLFCGKDNLQVLCKPCHEIKTKAERKQKTK